MQTISKDNVTNLVKQFNLEHLTTGRAPLIGQGWSDIEIDESFFNESIEQIIGLLNIREAQNLNKVRFKLRNEPMYAWFASFFHWDEHRQGWTYTAGQDYTAEIKSIRL